MNHQVQILCRNSVRGNVGMNLWLTQRLKSVYRQDWCWDYSSNGYLYSFKDEQIAVLFSLRWA